jgi:hypothetical protein
MRAPGSPRANRGSTMVELVIFVGAVVVPFGATCFWLMARLLEWFTSMEAVISSPF